jgi:hypothetical protein
LGQPHRVRAALTTGRPGDECDLAFDATRHRYLIPWWHLTICGNSVIRDLRVSTRNPFSLPIILIFGE